MQVSYDLTSSVILSNDLKYVNLQHILSDDLDFHDESSNLLTHGIHAFPAKFPSQIPGRFISELTKPGDVVLDTMMGSGTTVLEAYSLNRIAIGMDVDPLAVLMTDVKTSSLNSLKLETIGSSILGTAITDYKNHKEELNDYFLKNYDDHSREFIDYWFHENTKYELISLLTSIHKISDAAYKKFFLLALSNIIIRKSGGVSLALDLAHTRPHKVKAAMTASGDFLFGEDVFITTLERKRPYMSKIIRSAHDEFRKSYQSMIKGFDSTPQFDFDPIIGYADVKTSPLPDESIDLIVTSPPYASNAIDYMRAHKFSLVWLGYPIDVLTQKRKSYIGTESLKNLVSVKLPDYVEAIITEIQNRDSKKAQIVHQYFHEMRVTFEEFYRLLKPEGIAIIVVASSIIKGIDIQTDQCLTKIAAQIGFDIAGIGTRNLDRNRRLLPTSINSNHESQIQKRMHQEFVIGIYKRG